MSCLVDSSVWIDFFNRKSKSPEKEALERLIANDYALYLCPAVYQEVLQGIRDDRAFEETKYILQYYGMVDVHLMAAANHAVNLYRGLRKKGITIRKPVDCLIASYAMLGDLHILHNDNDFNQIAKGSGLKIYRV